MAGLSPGIQRRTRLAVSKAKPDHRGADPGREPGREDPSRVESWQGGEAYQRAEDAAKGRLDDSPPHRDAPEASPGQERSAVDVMLTPEDSVRVSGIVRGPDGPSAGREIQLWVDRQEAPGTRYIASVLADQAGRFRFLALPQATTSFVCQGRDHRRRVRLERAFRRSSERTQVAPSSPTSFDRRGSRWVQLTWRALA